MSIENDSASKLQSDAVKKTRRQKWAGRPPDSVIDDRVAEMVATISARVNIHRCELHKLLCPRWKCHWKTVDRIEGRARALILERSNRPKEDWITDILAAYERELGSDKPGVRLAALEGIRELLGLDAPKQMRVAGALNAPPISVETKNPCAGLSEERLRFIASGGLRQQLTGNAEEETKPNGSNGHAE